MIKERTKILLEGKSKNGPVVYWMQRDQRVDDNWALIHAFQKANENKEKLYVIFNIVDEFLEATYRQYYFMIEGLKEVEAKLTKLNIEFKVLLGNPESNIPKFLKDRNASILITDFNPLKVVTNWKQNIQQKIDIPFHMVDAHNIVPVWQASTKQEFGAYTIRPKIHKNIPKFLVDFPKIKKRTGFEKPTNDTDWDKIYKSLKIDFSVKPVDNFQPGEKEAKKLLKTFVESKLNKYSDERNDPNKEALSNLSPYLHFGQISAQRIALMLNSFAEENESVSSFFEELVVRKELSDNYCYYNKNYDKFDGFPDWAKKTLNEHRNDNREYVYKLEEFEKAQTHDDLWNAAQLEMITTGKMHGYMRMYWAKKILEWTESPEQALEFGIYLNDKYELDGRDPNGYVGMAWSIGGVHDRAWAEREVFGKIRYMNYNGSKRKFDVKSYINKYKEIDQQNLF